MNKLPKIAIVVPAAGVGSRMQLSHPKQYLKIEDKTVLEHTLNKMMRVPNVCVIAVAVSDSDTVFDKLAFCSEKLIRTSGGKERAESVLNALDALLEYKPDWVLVHDAARPLVDITDIENLISHCLEAQQGGILAAKVKDTIKRGSSHSSGTVPRDDLWQALTPQMFPFMTLRSALSCALQQGVAITDEASAMEWQQQPVQLIPGRTDNIKITTPEDYDLACFLISKQHKRV
ncbi:2-C-methyl-D-erythritol 4-phosphate cytidylyltransferase [Pseudoalteromonas sp. MMG012]|uniref:2-C-methyl-D-erythritol 4-phosphate cytidylyltransferase n=1 Tax=Pseudoalteromonas sp. MMG012 TaxID=2822686 RepID=UPI001B3A02DE|nr:2-C-methyl-D-erythritol 4-phosphate cytidylyltransferase [Pseudoalteromonas sp. MMG012]MBQ4851543.1 2-C-methyl-D-erythritol 4-phosphate cytidylyltransferase [Pseudoalteromonas sp. MMG012]